MPEFLTEVQWRAWILPLALAAGGFLVGLAAERIIMGRLRALVKRTDWAWDDLLVSPFHGMFVIWFTVAGVFAAKQAAPLPTGLAVALDKVIIVVLGLSFTVAGARAAAAGIRTWARRAAGAVPSTSLLQNVARLLVYVLGVFLILQNLGVKVGALVASLGIGGLAVALALQDTLSNLFAGFQIILARQVRNGDYVQLDTGQEGFVTDIKWRNTTIKSRVEDHEVVVPNAKLANAIVTNYSLPREAFWVRLEVGVSYDSDLERVEEVTLEVARAVLEEFGEAGGGNEPVFRYQGFGDSAITFRLRIRVTEFTRQFPVRHEMVKRIHARYREEGIEIPFPIRTLFAPDGVRVQGATAEGAPEELREVAAEE